MPFADGGRRASQSRSASAAASILCAFHQISSFPASWSARCFVPEVRHELQPELLDGLEGKEKTARFVGEGTNAIAFIECSSALILGINDNRVNGDCRACQDEAAHRIEHLGHARAAHDRWRDGRARQPARGNVATASPKPAAIRPPRNLRRLSCSNRRSSPARRLQRRIPALHADVYPVRLVAEGRYRAPVPRARRRHGHGASRAAR